MSLLGSDNRSRGLSVMSNLIDGRVSIVVPVYNTAAEYLEECFASVEGQTYENIELIIVNDGSTRPETNAFCNEYAERGARGSIVSCILVTTRNGGVSAARWAGIECAGGSWMMFLDSDDRLEKEAVARLVQVMAEQKVDAVIAQSEAGKAIPPLCRYDGKEILAALIENREASFGWALWGKLFDTELMKRYYSVRADIFYGEDLLVNAKYFSRAASAVVIDEKLYFYRKDNPESAMAQARSVKKLSLIPMWREMADIYQENGMPEETERIMANYYDSLLSGYLQCEYYRYEDYKRIMKELKGKLKDSLAAAMKNRYVTGKYRYIAAAYFLWIFKIKRFIKDRG